jgi:glutathione synthase/RimK-type ligase-like ATP-grasp enzyme
VAASKVLIVSHLFEPSVNTVIAHLERRGILWARLNCEEFPLFAAGRIEVSGGRSFAVIDTENGSIDTRDVSAVWFRRSTKAAVPKYLNQNDKDFVRNESNAFLNGALDLIDARWVNRREAERQASSKLYQLAAAVQAGLRIPKTVATNDPAAVRAFVASVDGRVLFKPVAGFAPRGADFSHHLAKHFGDRIEIEVEAHPDSDHTEVVFAQILTPEKLDRIDSLSLSPAIFQEYIEKAADIRVTIVGERIFSCRICSQRTEATAVDFRRMVLLDDADQVPHEAHRLPPEIAGKLLGLMQTLGLSFGCIDLVETIDGEYVFLEVNPSGQWMWIEQRLGLPISEALVDELTRPAAA